MHTRHPIHHLKCAHRCTALQATFFPSAPVFPPRYCRMAQALAEVDGGNTTRPHPPSDPQVSYTKIATAPAPASFTTQPQHWLDEDVYDHYGDDEQEYGTGDTESDCERERSATSPPAQQQQQQQQQQRPPQSQVQPQQPQPTSAPSPFVPAHVHFHSRVRITSGLRRSHGSTPHALGDSSDSDSPSSSISAPLHFRSRDTMPRAPLTERVSRLATQALQRRRAVAAMSRLRARDCEYAPLVGAGVPVTYGAARYGVAVNGHRANGVRDQSHGEDDSAFGEWPWRALNRHVGDCCFSHGGSQLMIVQWWKWQIESTLCCCCSDGSDAGE